MDALLAIETCRAMRHLRPDSVPEELLRRVLHAATCASSPGNSQGWDFVVVREAARRARIARAFAQAVGPLLPAVPQRGDAVRRRMLEGARHLLERAGEVPVWIFACGRPVYPPGAPSAEWIPAAVYPAAQNLIVAARALGLGAAFTTWHRPAEPAVREILALPDEVQIAVTLPLGWPARRFGPVARRPLDEVVHWDGWSRPAR